MRPQPPIPPAEYAPIVDAAPPTLAPPRRRRRLLLTLAAISVGWKVVVFTIGIAVPRWLIDDGVGALPSDLRPYGRAAKASAASLWNGPIERYGFVRTLRVMSVDHVADGGAVAQRCGGLGARVRAYTYFGVPYSEARMVCDSGVVEYRVFRRRGARPTAVVPLVPTTTREAVAPRPSASALRGAD